MTLALFQLLAAAALAGVPVPTLDRPQRDETIYVLKGQITALETFHAEIASDWKGGELVSKDADKNTYRYWAYTDRTAAQSREFIMPSMIAGFELEFETYVQDAAFPSERVTLDVIATECGAKQDPFFITPLGELEFLAETNSDDGMHLCLIEKLEKSELPLPIRSGDWAGMEQKAD